MNRRDTAVLALRLAALYALLQALESATGTISLFLLQSHTMEMMGVHKPGAMLALFAPCAGMFFVGIFLFLRAPTLARRFLPEDEIAATTPISPAPTLAFAIVGLAAFFYALPGVVSYSLTIVQSGDAKSEFYRYLPNLVGISLQFILGFMLFVRPQRLALWWQRKRQNMPNA
jgi:hypothetical protein